LKNTLVLPCASAGRELGVERQVGKIMENVGFVLAFCGLNRNNTGFHYMEKVLHGAEKYSG
jgi:aminoglycoside N3'-acetyltransferase